MKDHNEQLKKVESNESNESTLNLGNLNLNADKFTMLQDVADLEYDEDYATLVAEQG